MMKTRRGRTCGSGFNRRSRQWSQVVNVIHGNHESEVEFRFDAEEDGYASLCTVWLVHTWGQDRPARMLNEVECTKRSWWKEALETAREEVEQAMATARAEQAETEQALREELGEEY